MNKEDMKYYYSIYGLNIESEVLVPEFLTLNNKEKNNIDVNISYGLMPEEIQKSIDNGINAKYSKQYMWFHIKNLASYLIYNGDTVIVEPYKDADSELIKVYIMGSVLGMILLQRDTVAIHGGSIVIDGKGCIFTGDKGAGKSTLTTALRKRGYDFISDDVGAISTGDINMIQPGFGYQKLCEDAMIKLGYDTSKYTPFRSDMNTKYIVPALDSFVSTPVPFNAIFEIEVDDIPHAQVNEILGNDKLQRMIKNIFRIEILMYAGGMSPQYLKKCIEIAKSIKYYKITRPRNKFTVDDQISLIEEIMDINSYMKFEKLG